MTEDELFECRDLSRMLADIELKLAFWKHQYETAGCLVDKLSEKQGILLLRQKSLLEGKAKAAGV